MKTFKELPVVTTTPDEDAVFVGLNPSSNPGRTVTFEKNAVLAGTVQTIQNYDALRAYAGPATTREITSNSIAGVFSVDSGDTTTADNGGTVIVDSTGRRWKRVFSGAVASAWFGVSAAASAAINTPLLQSAIDAADHVVVDGGVIPSETLTMSRFGSTLSIASGTTLQFQNPAASSIVVDADLCTIDGGGTIKNTPTFNGTQGEFFYGVVYVTGNDLTIRDTRIDGVPKAGVHIKNSTRHKLIGVSINGQVLKSSYNENDPNTLNNHAILYDPPPETETEDAGLQVLSCEINGVVQGIGAGNFGSTARNGGLVIQGNVFRHCWDHGTYLNGTASNYSLLNGNSFYECRRPVVSGGVGASVIGNTATASTMDATMEQVFSIRDAINCNISDNIILGYGAAIDARPLLGSVTSGNRIANNTVKATGVSLTGCCIRVGGTTCENNTVAGNTAEGYPTPNFAVCFMDSGRGNTLDANNITSLNTYYAILFKNQVAGSCSGNRIEMRADAVVTTTAIMMFVDGVTNSNLAGNSFYYTSGGANVTLRGMSLTGVTTGNKVTDNVFDLTAPSLVGVTAQFNLIYTTSECARNWLSRAAPMCAAFSWSTGTPSVTVTNANIVAGSTVDVIPTNSQAGTIQKTNGAHVTVAAGSFTLATSDGANTAATSGWRYVIR